MKWKYKIGNATWQSSPAIDKNGMIYLGDMVGFLHAFRDKGPGWTALLRRVRRERETEGP